MPIEKSAERLGRQLLKNSLLMVLSRAAGILALLLSVPVIVSYLGPEGYGVWESVMAIAGMVTVLQMVVSGTILWQISMSFGVQDPAETRRIVRIGIGATLLLIAAILPLVWIYRDLIINVLQIPGKWSGDIQWILPSVVGILLLGGVNQSLLAVVTGYQRAGIASLIQSLGLIATSLTSIGALVLGGGLDALLLSFLAGFTTMLAILYPLASSLCGRISLVPLWPTRNELAVIGPFAGLLLLSNLTFLFRDHADKVVLASLVSPTMTGYFAMAQRLSMMVMQVGTVICLPLTAAVGSLHAQKDWRSIQDLYVQVGGWMGAFAGLAGFLGCTLRKPLFTFWLGADQPEAHGFLVFLLLGVTSALIFAGAGVALAKGIGRPGLETIYTIATLVLILLTKPALIAIIGPIGAVASSAGSWCLGAMFFLFLLHRKLELPRVMISRTLGLFSVTLLVSAIGWWGGEQFTWADQGRFGAAMILLAATPLLTVGYLGVISALRLVRMPHIGYMIQRDAKGVHKRRDMYDNPCADMSA